MTDIGPQRAAPSSPARVQAQSRAVLWARCYKDCGPDEFRERANKTHKLLNVPQDCDLKDGAGDIGG